MRRHFIVLTFLAVLGCSQEPAEPTPGTDPAGDEDPLGGCAAAAEPFGTEAAGDESLPDMELFDCDNTATSLATLRCTQELTWVAVGAGWCAPCQAEAAELEAVRSSYAGEVDFVGILGDGETPGSIPSPSFCNSWVENLGLGYPVVTDPNRVMMSYLDVAQMPYNLLIDRDGKVLWSGAGIADIDAVIESHR